MHSCASPRLTMAPHSPKAAGEHENQGVAMCTVAPMPSRPTKAAVPDGSRGGGQGADEMGHGVWDVDGQGRDMGLDGLHRGLERLLLLPLLAGQGGERYLDVCAREPERAPATEQPCECPAGLRDVGSTQGRTWRPRAPKAWGPSGVAELPRSPLPVQLTRYPQLRNETTKAAHDFNILVNKTSFRPAKQENKKDSERKHHLICIVPLKINECCFRSYSRLETKTEIPLSTHFSFRSKCTGVIGSLSRQTILWLFLI